MTTIRLFRIAGVKLWFWSADHNPPNFHAKRQGEWEVRVHFLLDPDEMIETIWENKHPSPRVLKKLVRLAEKHRVQLLEEWERIHRP